MCVREGERKREERERERERDREKERETENSSFCKPKLAKLNSKINILSIFIYD